MKLRGSRALRNPGDKRRAMIIAITAGVLLIALVITVIFLVRSDRKIDQNRTQIEETILDNMTMMLRTYERFSEPKPDITGSILPEMNKYLYTAYTQDNILSQQYGADASLMGNELYTHIEEAILAIERNVKADRIIDEKNNELQPYMDQIKGIVADHLKPMDQISG